LTISKSQSTKLISLKKLYNEANANRKSLKLKPLSDNQIKKAAVVAGDILVEEINKSLDKGASPVEGGEYKHLLANGKSISKLLDDGDMRAHITHKQSANGLYVGIFKDAPKIERLKASGHNQGDSVTGVRREFIADKKDKFKESIMNKVNEAVKKSLTPRTALAVKDGN